MLSLLYFILVLGVIVLVHEFGHFIFSKIFGVYVDEFAIGMGPKLLHYKKKGGETEYTLRLIPIGGFCSLAGEGGELDSRIPKERTLQGKPVWQRFLIMFFGAGNNFILAILILFFSAVIWGAPTTTPVLSSVEENSPADLAGIEAGDVVQEINGNHISTLDDVALFVTIADQSKPMTFEIKKEDGSVKEVELTPDVVEEDGVVTYKIGIGLQADIRHDFGSMVEYTFVKTGSIFKQMWVTVSGLFTGQISIRQLSGPVGIYNVVDQQAKAGFENLLYLVALLSINVGFLNLLPFPAFDGGRILFLIIEKIKGSPVKPETENMIHTIGFFLLLALMVYVTFNDVLRLF